MRNFILFFVSILLSIYVNATECNNLTLTSGTYSETDDLIAAIQGEFGSGYTIGDWTDLEAISDIDEWISCMGLTEDQTFMLTRNGEYFYNNSNRQYYVQYSSDGIPYPGFLVHDQIGSLYLGSWYGLDCNVLAKNACSGIECNNLKTTCETYSETDDLIAAIQGEFGSGYTIGDWTDLEAISDIDEWISCMGLSEDQTFMLTRNGEYFYNNSNRQYYVQYSSDGIPYPGFLVHDQIGSLYLGSWYGLDCKVLAKNGSTSVDEQISSAFLIYPNPTKGKLTISIANNGKYKLNIINSLGQVIYTDEIDSNQKYLDMTGINTGIYFVVIRDFKGDILLSKKIIKE